MSAKKDILHGKYAVLCINVFILQKNEAFMNLYCKIFVDTISEYDDFFENVRNFVSGQKKAISGIVSEWCEMSIRKNKEYIPESIDFLYWKYIMDIDPQNISADCYINNMKNLMCFLKLKYFCAVIACDFEDMFITEK